MKVGIKRVSESEWLVHIEFAWIRLDRFSVELLNMSLENAVTQNSSAHLLHSYLKLGLKLDELDDRGLQKVLRVLDPRDLVVLLQAVKQPVFTNRLLNNMGGLLAKQVERDLQNNEMPTEDAIKQSIRRIAEKTFDLEQKGEVEFFNEHTQYI